MSQRYEHSTWQSCFRELAPKLLLYARQWLPTVADAEDVVQTAFVRFWKKHPGATRENYPLLYTAVRTASLDLLRGEERRARRENEPEVGLPVEGTPTFDPAPGDEDTPPIAFDVTRQSTERFFRVQIINTRRDGNGSRPRLCIASANASASRSPNACAMIAE